MMNITHQVKWINWSYAAMWINFKYRSNIWNIFNEQISEWNKVWCHVGKTLKGTLKTAYTCNKTTQTHTYVVKCKLQNGKDSSWWLLGGENSRQRC